MDRPNDIVRVGADFNGTLHLSEVTRIDFDTDEGEMSICVEYLASRGVIVVDMFNLGEPAWRERIAEFGAPNAARSPL